MTSCIRTRSITADRTATGVWPQCQLTGPLADTLSPRVIVPPLRLYAVLVRVKRENVTLEDVHDVWVAWMTDVDPSHAALQPYEALDVPTRHEDAPFAEAIRTLAREEAR